ncbi:MAG: ubiquinone/menaquinone biosynthesis C-methylase UbiE, partial [Myxococcota bacterium]
MSAPDRHDESRKYYDTFASGYEKQRHHGYHQWLDDRTIGLLKPLATGKKVLEVGAGTGLLLRGVAEFADEAVGMDLSHGMLEKAQQRGLTVVEGSATELPFADASFDLVYSFKVLAHVPDIEGTLREITRVTKPGGRMVLEFYNKRSLRHMIRRLRPSLTVGPGTDESQVYTRFHNQDELEAMLPNNVRLADVSGFRVATVLPQIFKVPGVGGVW